MKRYLLFAGSHYYPNGGWGDMQGDFDTLEGTTDHRMKFLDDHAWFYVIDTETMLPVGEMVDCVMCDVVLTEKHWEARKPL